MKAAASFKTLRTRLKKLDFPGDSIIFALLSGVKSNLKKRLSLKNNLATASLVVLKSTYQMMAFSVAPSKKWALGIRRANSMSWPTLSLRWGSIRAMKLVVAQVR